jgi:hypothetical protein
VNVTIGLGDFESTFRELGFDRLYDIKVSYFDAPLTDNLVLEDNYRLAITLKKTYLDRHPREAGLNVLQFQVL